MTWVKLCGMTRREDAVAAQEAGADAVGFVVYPGSPRRISLDRVADLGRGLDIERYLVTVGIAPGALLDAAERAGVSGVQPHGGHAAEAAAAALAAGLDVLFPVPMGDGPPDLAAVPAGCIPMLDRASGRHGGTGLAFDWSLAAGMSGRWVLAGGLTPGSVGEAIATVHPWGVDVASGVEASPGVKDHDLMRRFVAAAR